MLLSVWMVPVLLCWSDDWTIVLCLSWCLYVDRWCWWKRMCWCWWCWWSAVCVLGWVVLCQSVLLCCVLLLIPCLLLMLLMLLILWLSRILCPSLLPACSPTVIPSLIGVPSSVLIPLLILLMILPWVVHGSNWSVSYQKRKLVWALGSTVSWRIGWISTKINTGDLCNPILCQEFVVDTCYPHTVLVVPVYLNSDFLLGIRFTYMFQIDILSYSWYFCTIGSNCLRRTDGGWNVRTLVQSGFFNSDKSDQVKRVWYFRLGWSDDRFSLSVYVHWSKTTCKIIIRRWLIKLFLISFVCTSGKTLTNFSGFWLVGPTWMDMISCVL